MRDANNLIIKTKTHTGTWCDAEGTLVTHHLDKRSDGLRICVHAWKTGPKAGKTDVTLIKGDGRTVTFKTYMEATAFDAPGVAGLIHDMLEAVMDPGFLA